MKMNNSPRLLCRSLLKALLAATIAAVLSIVLGTAHGQIFVTGGKGSTEVGEYNLDGTTVNASLISGFSDPQWIGLSGSNLFVKNSHTIGKYNLDGTAVNPSLITLFNSSSMAVFGSRLFVVYLGTIREYTTDGQLVNASLITGLNNPFAIEVSGSDLFVSTGDDTIARYTTSGTLLNPSLITGLSSPSNIAVYGTDLFVTNARAGTIGRYTTAGETVNASLVSGLDGPRDVAILGSNLFVANGGSFTVGEYTTSGATVNATLITGLEGPAGIAVVPEPSAWAFAIAGSGVLLMFRVRYRHASRKGQSKARALMILTISFLLPLATPERGCAQAVRTDAAYTSTVAEMLRAGYDPYERLGPWDDGATDPIELGFTENLNFLGMSTSSIIINNNGNITFTNAIHEYNPEPNPFTINYNVGAIIGPFFADVDTRPVHQGTSTNPDAKLVTYGTSSVDYGGSVDQRPAFGINWVGIGFYNRKEEPLNEFQLIIIDRSDTGAGNFDFEFNYDQILWETGTASGGSANGRGGYSARVGFSNDAGVIYEFPGSGINGALVDDSVTPETALINNSLNSGVPAVPGRYVFQVRNNVNKPVAYWKGSGSSWNGSNWTVDQAGTTALTGVPEATTDVIFSAASSSTPSTTLGANFSIHSLTMNDSRAVTIASSTNTLTLTNGGLITPSGRNGITVNAGAGAVNITSSLVLDPGNETITINGTAQLTVAGNVSASVLAKRGTGTLNLNGMVSSGMVVNVGEGTVNFCLSQTLGALHVSSGAMATVVAHSGGAGNATVLDVSELGICGNGALDRTNNALIVRGGDLSAITGLIQTGLYGPGGPANPANYYWDGPGINSSVASADPYMITAVGVVDNSMAGYTTFAGVSGLTGNEILVKYTYYGDADLNGLVDSTDYFFIDNGFALQLTGWLNGDFNYDGQIDSTDYSFIDYSFGAQGTPL